MPNVDYGIWGNRVGDSHYGGAVGPILASATEITPTHPIHHVSGTTQITAITLPWTGFLGQLTLIADAAWSFATGGTAGKDIGAALTAVAGQAVTLTFDGATWYPHMMD